MAENQTLITSGEALENIVEGNYLIHGGKIVIYSGIEDGNLNFVFKDNKGHIFRYNLPGENISFDRKGMALFKQNPDYSFKWMPDYELVGEERRRIEDLLSQAGL